MVFKIILLMFVLVFQSATGLGYTEELVERAEFINGIHVQYGSLNYPEDVMTLSQAERRVQYIFKYAEEYNDMYPNIHYKSVGIDLYAIIEWETGWANYEVLDGGISFGYISMRFNTADEIMDELGITEGNYYDEKLQAKLITYYYYEKLRRYDGNRDLAILAYNRGFNLDRYSQRYENYYFQVKGRRDYIKDNVMEGGM